MSGNGHQQPPPPRLRDDTFNELCELFKLSEDPNSVTKFLMHINHWMRTFRSDRPRSNIVKAQILASFLALSEYSTGRFHITSIIAQRDNSDATYEVFFGSHADSFDIIERSLVMIWIRVSDLQSMRTLDQRLMEQFLDIVCRPDPEDAKFADVHFMWLYEFPGLLELDICKTEETPIPYQIPRVEYKTHVINENNNHAKATMFVCKLKPALPQHVERIKNAFQNRDVVAATSPPGSGKSTALLLGLQLHYKTIFVALPTNTTAFCLYTNLKSKSVDCGLMCGRPEDLHVCADPMSHPMVIVTYGVLRNLLVRGVFPHLLVLDELFSACDDKDRCLNMLRKDLTWTTLGTKVLGVSASHNDNSRLHVQAIIPGVDVPVLPLLPEEQGRTPVSRNTLVLYCSVTHTVLRNLIDMFRDYTDRRFIDTVNDIMNQEVQHSGIGRRVYEWIAAYIDLLEPWLAAWRSPTVSMADTLRRTLELIGDLNPQFIVNLYPLVKRMWSDAYGHTISFLPEAAISFINYTDLKNPKDDSVPIIFGKGFAELRVFQNYLRNCTAAKPLEIIILHSKTIGMGELERATHAPKDGSTRRIVIATSLAETSVTLWNVKAVFDGNLTKASIWDHHTGCTRLINVTCSAAQREQRRGRAERSIDYTLYASWERTTNVNDREIMESMKMPNVQDVMLELIVFSQKRGVLLDRESFVQEVHDLTFHEKEVIEHELDLLQNKFKFITKNLLVTLAGHHAYGIALSCEDAFAILVSANLGTLRSVAWATMLTLELEGGPPVNEKTTLNYQYCKEWNAFFHKNVPYSSSRAMEYRAMALWISHSSFPTEAATRAAASYQIMARCRNEVKRLEEYILDYGYNNISRNDDKPAIVLLSIAIGCGSRWGRRTGLHTFAVGDLSVFGTEFSAAQLASRHHSQDFATYGNLLFNREDGFNSPSFTELPGLIAALGLNLFSDPESVDQYIFRIGNSRFNSEQKPTILALRRYLKHQLLISFGMCPLWQNHLDEKLDVLLVNCVWEGFRAGGNQRRDHRARNVPQSAFIFDPRDPNAHRIVDVMKLHNSAPKNNGELDIAVYMSNEKEMLSKELFRDLHGLPYAGGASRFHCCSRCHHRGHIAPLRDDPVDQRGRFRLQNLEKYCPASDKEVLQRRRNFALLPNEVLGTDKARRMRDNMRDQFMQPHALALNPVCWCGSIMHLPDFDDDKCNGYCRRCGSKEPHGNNCREALYFCTDCKIPVHMREHCFVDRLYMKRTYGEINILQFREILDAQIMRRNIFLRRRAGNRYVPTGEPVDDWTALNCRFIDVLPEQILPIETKDVAFDSPMWMVYH